MDGEVDHLAATGHRVEAVEHGVAAGKMVGLSAGGTQAVGAGREEVVRAGEVYYWPPGPTVWVEEDYEAIETSPSRGMDEVIEHLKKRLG